MSTTVESTVQDASLPQEETRMPETPTFGRYAEIPYEQMTPEQRAAYDFAVGTRGPLMGPNKIWVHNPKLTKVAAPFGGHFQPGGYSLTEREREIAVIIINSKWHSAYPTAAHERRGKEVGLPADKVEAMLSGLATSFDDPREQVVYEMAVCLSNARWVPKGLYERAVAALGHVGITDAICLMGHYSSVSMTLAFYDVPAGAPGLAR
jgi:4-carboxymuconolactone decarboxylase